MRISALTLNCVVIFALMDVFHMLNFEFLKPQKVQRRKKPKAVREVEKDVLDSLKNALLAERKAIVKQSIGLRMIGMNVACPPSCIEAICAQAKFITSSQDIKSIPCIRSIFVERFFAVFNRTVSL